jgi:transcriptional regulator with XRE-family HTH domain
MIDTYFNAKGAFTARGLAEARRAAGFSQTQLAALIGRSSISVSRWERDVCEIPSTLYPLLPDVLGVEWPCPRPPSVDADPADQ